MVKNTHGGSGHKKFARKHTSGAKSNKLRVSEDEGEIYAIVTKMLGNGMFHCHCIDGVIRLGHIRGKFSGRGKRDNMVDGGKWVLIGLREWDKDTNPNPNPKQKLQQCDLLEVYNDFETDKLKTTVNQDWSVFIANDEKNSFSTKKETESAEFWDPILASEEFKKFVETKYRVSNGSIFGDHDIEDDIDAVFADDEDE
mgnify:CR=1 FL=1